MPYPWNYSPRLDDDQADRPKVGRPKRDRRKQRRRASGH